MNEHIRIVLLFAFNQGAKSAWDICPTYEDDLITDRMGQKCFSPAKVGNFEHAGSPRSGRPVQLDENQLRVLIKGEPYQTPMELAQKMTSSHVILACLIHSVSKVQKHGAWVPHA